MAPHPLWRGLGCFRRARALAYGIGVGITVIGCQQDEPHQGFDPSSTPQVTIIPDSARPLQSAALVATTLLAESFDNAAVGARGWYDNTAPSISTTQKHGGGGALQWSYAKGATKPANGGAMRRKFTPTDRVYARFWVRYNETWVGSARAYHPHELQFVTTEDDDYVGPASTRLTAYVEHNYQNGGIPRVHLTDSRNIDVARVRQDLTGVTEQRAIAGCNGNSDAYTTDCFPLSSTEWLNEKAWKGNAALLTRGSWHQVEAYFQLNTLTAGKADRNGIVRYWLDNQLLIEHTDVVFRTGARPNMKFNQVILAPYIGDGAPVPQTAWIDDLFLATDRAGSSEPPPPTVPPIFGLTLSPTSATLTPGGSVTFKPLGWIPGADTSFVPPVTWTATGGTVTTAGVYTAGAIPGQYLVTARSTVSANFEQAAITITGTAVITAISVTPASVSLAPARTQQFVARATLSNGNTQANPSVTWRATGGTVSTSGLYTSPVTPGSYRVIATGGNGMADTSTVQVTSSAPPPPPPVDTTSPLPPPPVPGIPELPGGYTLRQTWTGNPMVPSGWDVSSVSNYSLVTDGTAPASPSSVVRIRYPASHLSGNGPGRIEWNANNASNVLVTYWFKYDPNFNGDESSVNKHIFLFGCNNVLAFSGLRFVGNVSSGSVDAIPENGATGAAAFQWLAGIGGQRVTVNKAAWTRVTMEVTRSPDSRIRLWANGTKVADRAVTFNDNGCRYVKIDPTYGGNTGKTIGREGYLFFDEVRIYTK